jgi:hypothetical protein
MSAPLVCPSSGPLCDLKTLDAEIMYLYDQDAYLNFWFPFESVFRQLTINGTAKNLFDRCEKKVVGPRLQDWLDRAQRAKTKKANLKHLKKELPSDVDTGYPKRPQPHGRNSSYPQSHGCNSSYPGICPPSDSILPNTTGLPELGTETIQVEKGIIADEAAPTALFSVSDTDITQIQTETTQLETEIITDEAVPTTKKPKKRKSKELKCSDVRCASKTFSTTWNLDVHNLENHTDKNSPEYKKHDKKTRERNRKQKAAKKDKYNNDPTFCKSEKNRSKNNYKKIKIE